MSENNQYKIKRKLTTILLVFLIILSLVYVFNSGNSVKSLPLTAEKTYIVLPTLPASLKPLAINGLEMHIINVGQADSILLRLPNNKNMLIDTGDKNAATKIINYLISQGIGNIDYLISTNPNNDYIGSMKSIIDTFNIDKIYMPEKSVSSKAFKELMYDIALKKQVINRSKAGIVLINEDNLKVEFLSPISSTYDNTGDYSSVLNIQYGKTRFILMGDAEFTVENELLRVYPDIKADVLKVGRHGANSGTSKLFLDKIQPKIAVISVDGNNANGYPAKNVLDRLSKSNSKTYRTDIDGDIVIVSDGEKVYKK